MIKVKQLEWVEETAYGYYSHRCIAQVCELSRYLIQSHGDVFFTVLYASVAFNKDSGDYCMTRYNTINEAKLACQKHYESLILSGIEVTND